MSARTLAVVSAGLSVPSSTRLLADRLAAATAAAAVAAPQRAQPLHEIVQQHWPRPRWVVVAQVLMHGAAEVQHLLFGR